MLDVIDNVCVYVRHVEHCLERRPTVGVTRRVVNVRLV